MAQRAIRPPDLVRNDGRRLAEQDLARLLLVLDHLADDLPQVIEQLFFRLAKRRLVRQLEEVSDDLAPLPVQPPKRQSDLGEALQNFADLLRQDESGQVD